MKQNYNRHHKAQQQQQQQQATAAQRAARTRLASTRGRSLGRSLAQLLARSLARSLAPSDAGKNQWRRSPGGGELGSVPVAMEAVVAGVDEIARGGELAPLDVGRSGGGGRGRFRGVVVVVVVLWKARAARSGLAFAGGEHGVQTGHDPLGQKGIDVVGVERFGDDVVEDESDGVVVDIEVSVAEGVGHGSGGDRDDGRRSSARAQGASGANAAESGHAKVDETEHESIARIVHGLGGSVAAVDRDDVDGRARTESAAQAAGEG